MTRKFHHIEGIVWDLDGTLYRYDVLFKQACNLAAARTAIDLGLEMALDEAVDLATRSEELYGSSFRLFAERGIKYDEFHHPYHRAVDTTILRKNAEMRIELQSLGMPMVILTNASRDWALRTLDHLELTDIFTEKNILSLEDVSYKSKSTSPDGFFKAIGLLNLPASSVLMVEDLAANLIHAKALGMTTALVHHGASVEAAPHIDHFFQDTLDLVRALKT